MQPHIKNDLLYLLRIIEASQKIILYASKFSDWQTFYYSNDQLEFNACLSQLMQIGEQSKKISLALINKHTHISWVKIKGFRNRIVHDYIGIDTENDFSVVKNGVPELCDQMMLVISEELQQGNFDNEEFEISKTSPYLKHIDFSRFS